MERVPMTVAGHEQAKAELDNLKMVRRPKVIAAIAEARAHGDLKENAEYHAAREEQGFIEARIKDLEGRLSSAQVIDISTMTNNGKVIFGATVELYNVDTEQEVRYHIVGEDEANVETGKISVTSPIARGLIGKMEGDEVTIQTPQGKVTYEIIKVEYV